MPEWLVLAFTIFGVIFLLEPPDKTALATRSWRRNIARSPSSPGPRRPSSYKPSSPSSPARSLRCSPKTRSGSEQEVQKVERRFHAPLISAFVVVFVTEWGDLSQLATAAFQARYQRPVLVFTAALIALWCVAAIASVAGNRIGKLVPERPLQYAAAGVMAVVALLLLSGVLG